jgi:hypothetical protein
MRGFLADRYGDSLYAMMGAFEGGMGAAFMAHRA